MLFFHTTGDVAIGFKARACVAYGYRSLSVEAVEVTHLTARGQQSLSALCGHVANILMTALQSGGVSSLIVEAWALFPVPPV